MQDPPPTPMFFMLPFLTVSIKDEFYRDLSVWCLEDEGVRVADNLGRHAAQGRLQGLDLGKNLTHFMLSCYEKGFFKELEPWTKRSS